MTVECTKCNYFKITWEKNFPYACKAFGFKSQLHPSTEVLKAAGKECNKYSLKEKKK
jgi:hypothetical protein